MQKWLVFLICLPLLGCSRSEPVVLPTEEQSDYWPKTEWRSSTPKEQGMDQTILENLHQEFVSGQHGYIDGMLLIRNGYVIYEKAYTHNYQALFEGRGEPGQYNYYDPKWHPYYERGVLHSMQSVSKSVTSALVGIAIGRGEIPGVDIPVTPYFSEFKYQTVDDPLRVEMTLEHLLTMTAGIRWDEESVPYTHPANSCAGMEQSQDWVQFVLDQPMAEQPGSRFLYNSGATVLISYLLEQSTGKEVEEYAAEFLFGPLGIKNFFWKKTPRGLADTEGGLYLRPHDLARIGYLYLKDGIWEGKHLLPVGWVEASTQPTVKVGPEGSWRYGYKWWLLPDDEGGYAITGLGYGGQRLLVVPSLNLVAVFTGWNIYGTPSLNPQLALARILKAVKTR